MEEMDIVIQYPHKNILFGTLSLDGAIKAISSW